MIAFKIGDEFLDLNPNTSVGIEWYNPLFQKSDQTPGLLTYPITAPYSRTNQRILGNPEHLSLAEPPPTDFPCQFYINRVLWKIGILKYRGFNGQYVLNFQSDAGDFAAKTRDTSLTKVDYKADILSSSVKTLTDNYALFPVRNSIFFGDKNPPAGWNNYVNFYNAGFSGPMVPFPYLRFILSEIMRVNGYYISGDWLTEDYVKRLVIYNNFTLPAGPIDFRKHVPDINVSALLAAVRQLFGVGYVFDAGSKTVRIVRLKDVVENNAYIDWTAKADKAYSDDVLDRNGFTLKQTVESDDELNKTLSLDWAEYKIGAGREEITSSASTLHMVRETQGSRNWLVPATEQKGTSQATGTGENSKFSLRFLLYAGLQSDSAGGQYPLGSAVNENFAAAPFTNRSLHYAGPWGLYQNNYKSWVSFLDQARPVSRSVSLNMSDLLTLDPTRKILIDKIKYFYEKISLSVSSKDGIGKAKIDLRKVNV